MEEAIANFKAFIESAENYQTEIILILPPVSNRAPRLSGILEYNESIRYAFHDNAMILKLDDMDYDAPSSYGYFFPDGLHPNTEGAKYIAFQIAPLCHRIAAMRAESNKSNGSLTLRDDDNRILQRTP